MSEIAIATESGEVSTLPETAEEKGKQLPVPTGYHILVALPEVEEKYGSQNLFKVEC